jgi:hypothetical protein
MSVAVLGAVLAGCSDEADKMSRYPYFIEMLNDRWEIIRKSFASPQPNIDYAPVLLKDLSGALESMEKTYSGPNRDAAVAKLKEVYSQLYTELHAQLLMRGGPVTLKPGATVKGVGESLDKGYRKYTEFQALVKLE